MLEIKEVLRRWLRGESKSEIARQCRLARATIRSYIKAGVAAGLAPGQPESSLDEAALSGLAEQLQPGSGRPRGDGWEVCGHHREFIAGKLKQGVRLTKIRKLLRRAQVVVSYATLRRYAIAELGFGAGAGTIPVADGEPGREVQVDTGWVGWLKPSVSGRRRRFRAWIFTPSVSRYRFVYPVENETTATAIEACEAAWQFYGGIFEVIIPDNTKTIVDKADPLQPVINLEFLEYAQARGFFIDAARVRKATDKARVERTVRTVAEDCFGGELVLDVEHGRRHAYTWCREDNGLRRHGTTRRLPREHFEAEERPRLRPAPTEPYDIPVWSTPLVYRDQHAQVDYGLYSLPAQYKGRILDARADSTTVRFYLKRQLIKVHPRVPCGKKGTDVSDFQTDKAVYALRDIEFLKTRATENGAAIGRYAEALLDSPLPWTRMRQVYALLGLVKRFGAARVDDACATALTVELVDVYRLRRLIEMGSAKPPSEPPSRPAPAARFLRPAAQFALTLTGPKGQPEGEDE